LGKGRAREEGEEGKHFRKREGKKRKVKEGWEERRGKGGVA